MIRTEEKWYTWDCEAEMRSQKHIKRHRWRTGQKRNCESKVVQILKPNQKDVILQIQIEKSISIFFASWIPQQCAR